MEKDDNGADKMKDKEEMKCEMCDKEDAEGYFLDDINVCQSCWENAHDLE